MSSEEKSDELAEIVLKKSEPFSSFVFRESCFELNREERKNPSRIIMALNNEDDKDNFISLEEYFESKQDEYHEIECNLRMTKDIGPIYCIQLQFSVPEFCSKIEGKILKYFIHYNFIEYFLFVVVFRR